MPSRLFSPLSLRSMQLDNRIVVSPLAQFMADSEGNATDWHIMHLGNLALSGASLLMIEATAVEQRGCNTRDYLCLWTDAHERSLKRVVDFCRSISPVRLGIQLHHCGRKGSVVKPWEGLQQIPLAEGGWAMVSASALPYENRPNPVTSPDEAELARIKGLFVDSARRCARIGIDLIEMHYGHGYLMHSFLSPLSNLRTDRYGGDLEGRMRYPLEVFKAVREVWPEDRPLGVRISATDWTEGGWDIEGSVTFSRELKSLGCDYVSLSSGGLSPDQKIIVGPAYQVPFSERVRREAGIPTMAVGMLHEPTLAESVLAEGKADMVAIGRAMMADPRWPWRAAQALGEKMRLPLPYDRCRPGLLPYASSAG